MTIKAKCAGKLFAGLVGDGIDCYVLDDGTPVIHVGGIVKGIGAREKGGLQRYLAAIGSESLLKSVRQIDVSPPGGGKATCYPATFLIDVCGEYDRLADEGKLRADQMHMAQASRALIRACAKAGIERMVFAAAGYQEVLDQDRLSQKFAQWLSDERSQWTRMVTDRFVRSMCRLYRVEWDGGRQPRFLASVQAKIYRIVCGDDVANEIKRRNPKPSHGSNHHQFLNDDAREFYRQNLIVIDALAKQSSTPEEFERRLRAQFRDEPFQLNFGNGAIQ